MAETCRITALASVIEGVERAHPVKAGSTFQGEIMMSMVDILLKENADLQAGYDAARMEIASLQARIAERDAQECAIGAGGVEPLRKRCLHQISEPAQAQPVAWVIFAENGNRRMWTQNKSHAEAAAKDTGLHITPLYAAPQPAAQAQHPDDAAVEKLAEAMKQKLAEKRAQGRSGWDTDCTQQRLSDLLRQHVEKGDVLDVANFCAFLFARGERVSAAQAATAKQSPHPEYDKGFSDGWNRCEARQAAAPTQAGEYQPSSADMVMAALDTEEWGLERMQRWHCLTDEGNREGAWLVKRQKAPYCAVYTDKPGEPYGPRSWSGPTALDALQKAADDLGIHLPQPAARGAAQAAPVDAAVQQDAERYRWLTFDHADAATRMRVRAVLDRLPVMSYSAACEGIDAARAAQKGTND